MESGGNRCWKLGVQESEDSEIEEVVLCIQGIVCNQELPPIRRPFKVLLLLLLFPIFSSFIHCPFHWCSVHIIIICHCLFSYIFDLVSESSTPQLLTSDSSCLIPCCSHSQSRCSVLERYINIRHNRFQTLLLHLDLRNLRHPSREQHNLQVEANASHNFRPDISIWILSLTI